jgi:hypothetical protein
MKSPLSPSKIARLKSHKKGYTLLFAVLVSALVLAVGISLLDTTRKELTLTSGARESDYAFYAADAGYECALYYDYQGASGSGATFFSTTTFIANGLTLPLSCGTNAGSSQVSSAVTMVSSAFMMGTQYDFTFSMPIEGNACAYVDVNKIYNSSGVSTTTVSSFGYNMGSEGTSPNFDCLGKNNNTEKVDRELVTTYSGT